MKNPYQNRVKAFTKNADFNLKSIIKDVIRLTDSLGMNINELQALDLEFSNNHQGEMVSC